MSGGYLPPIPPRPPGWKPPIDPDDEISWPVGSPRLREFEILSQGTLMENVAMAKEPDWPGLVDEIEISESAGITVEQIDDEITVAIASVVCVHFQVTADQALKLSRALAVAADNAAKFLASTET
jgi:hypothetical protein